MTWQMFGYALMAIAGLRITDVIWPPKIGPWQFYAVEMAIGAGIIIWANG